jgi:alpha-ribazole phosphatase
MDLVLIRHPAVAVEAGICYGRTDVPLLRDAAESAHALRARMQTLGVPACEGAWHSSPLVRCASLARALSEGADGRFDARRVVRLDVRLAELNFGAWEGRAWDGIDRALIDAWAADIEHARPHGGESLAQFAARVLGWFDETCRVEAASVDRIERAVHVVAHAGVMRVLAAHLLGIGRADALQWALDFGGIVWLRRVAGAWALVRWNV